MPHLRCLYVYSTSSTYIQVVIGLLLQQIDKFRNSSTASTCVIISCVVPVEVILLIDSFCSFRFSVKVRVSAQRRDAGCGVMAVI